MAFTSISYSTYESIAHIKLNRPDKLNSFTLAMGREVIAALDEVARDSNVRALLISAEGRGFCAGQDISEVSSSLARSSEPPDLGSILKEVGNPIVKRIREIEKPVVCAVNGVAAGAGANLALSCDIVICAKDAFFVQSFSKIGLIPDYAGSFMLPRLVGLARATALAFLAEKLSAEQAKQIGLIYKVCESNDLLEEAEKLTKHLATLPTVGLALTKRAFNASFSNSLNQQLELEEELQRKAGRTQDFTEGLKAFFEKRPARFKGA